MGSYTAWVTEVILTFVVFAYACLHTLREHAQSLIYLWPTLRTEVIVLVTVSSLLFRCSADYRPRHYQQQSLWKTVVGSPCLQSISHSWNYAFCRCSENGSFFPYLEYNFMCENWPWNWTLEILNCIFCCSKKVAFINKICNSVA